MHGASGHSTNPVGTTTMIASYFAAGAKRIVKVELVDTMDFECEFDCANHASFHVLDPKGVYANFLCKEHFDKWYKIKPTLREKYE